MNLNYSKLNSIFNKIVFKEQVINNNINDNEFFKLKTNFYLKNHEKNRFLFITSLLLLERATGQRIFFLKDKTDTPRVKPVKIGCSITLRYENLYNFWKMLVFFSFPKLYDLILNKNNDFNSQNLVFLNLNKFLFFSCFSFFNDFDKFLLFYEDFTYYLSIELYSGFHKFLISKPLLNLYGLHFI